MIVKHKGSLVHVAVPGVLERIKKGQTVRRPSSMLEDMWQVATLFEEGDYPLLVVDTITLMLERALRDIVASDLSDNKKTVRPGVDVGSKPGGRISNATLPDYNTLLSAVDEWFYHLINVCTAADKALLILGHDQIITSEDIEGVTISAEGTVAAPGRKSGKMLPRNIQTMLRVVVKRVGRQQKRMIFSEPETLWYAKDRLGVWPNKLEIGVARMDDREAHKEAIIQTVAPYWDRWIDAVSDADILATALVYGPPGTGKTSIAAGMIQAMYEATEAPSLMFDCDGDGSVVLPKRMYRSEDEGSDE